MHGDAQVCVERCSGGRDITPTVGWGTPCHLGMTVTESGGVLNTEEEGAKLFLASGT